YYCMIYNSETVHVFDIALDIDGNTTNGYAGPWQNFGADYMIEIYLDSDGCSSDLFYSPVEIVKWNGDDANGWNWSIVSVEPEFCQSSPRSYSGNFKCIEGKVRYSGVFAKPDSIKAGVLAQNNEWDTNGIIPQVNIGDSVSHDAMLSVKVIEQDTLYINHNGLEYCASVPNKTATLLKSTLYPDNIVLPHTINYYGENYNVEMTPDMLYFMNTDIKSLEMQEGWTEVGASVFRNCSYLESVELPSTMQSIGYCCFWGCTHLNKVVVKAQVPPTIDATSFYGMDLQTPVYVPDASVAAYKADALWGLFNIQPMSNMSQGIHNATMDTKVTKRIVNGQLLIERDGKKYNAQGVEMK
ncbi:MAG: leucine-rich repeat domain-containing protein, partial [Paludibacteraceae bacterium]|nr:leucine-rich repeat domain-containing protein [Paludibacteraceae bacterium]